MPNRDDSDLRGDEPGRRQHDYLTRQLTDAMTEAMRRVLLDPEIIESMGGVALKIIQKQAAEKTGNWLLSLLKAFFNRWIVILVLAIVLAQVIGIPAAWRALAPVVTKGQP